MLVKYFTSAGFRLCEFFHKAIFHTSHVACLYYKDMKTTTKTYEIGERVSMQHVADRYPGTVVGIERGGRTLLVRQDTATPTPGAEPMSNKWTITENPNGYVETFTLRRDGSYRAQSSSHPFLTPGWSHYYSYEF